MATRTGGDATAIGARPAIECSQRVRPVSRRARGAKYARAATHRLLVELGVVGLAGMVYVVVRKITEGNPALAHDNAAGLYAFEQRVGIDWEHTLQGFVLHHDWLRTFANWIYIWGHWPVIFGVAVWLFINSRAHYVRLRNAVLASGIIGFAFFYLAPMAPPRLAGVGLVDTVTTWSGSYRVLQPPEYTNIYAAMPSLHFGWDLLVGLTLLLSTRKLALRVFGLAMPVCMAFAVIATANHWVLDVLVALLVVTTGTLLAELARHRWPAIAQEAAPKPAPPAR